MHTFIQTDTYIQTTESGKKMFAEISQRTFSEITSIFTEVAETKTKIAKSALYFQQNALTVRYQSSIK